MIKPKELLKSYMLGFSPNSYIGFFDTVSEILEELGNDWNTSEDKNGKRWADVFFNASIAIKGVVVSLSGVKDEFEAVNTRPADLIREFKIDVMELAK
jgi:hypothetical protein